MFFTARRERERLRRGPCVAVIATVAALLALSLLPQGELRADEPNQPTIKGPIEMLGTIARSMQIAYADSVDLHDLHAAKPDETCAAIASGELPTRDRVRTVESTLSDVLITMNSNIGRAHQSCQTKGIAPPDAGYDCQTVSQVAPVVIRLTRLAHGASRHYREVLDSCDIEVAKPSAAARANAQSPPPGAAR